MPVFLIGPEKSAGDIQGETDEGGRFVLNDIPPGNYYLIVWAPPYNWVPAENSSTDPTPRLIQLQAGKGEEMGIVYVAWP